MFIKSFPILAVAVLFISGLPGNAQIVEATTDLRPSYKATFAMGANAHYSVKKMLLTPVTGDQLGPQFTADTVYNMTTDAALQQAAGDILKVYIPSFAYYVPYVGWAYTACNIVLALASTENVQCRNYYVTTPAAAYYTFNVWVPGDVDQPCSMIKIYSINSDGSKTQVYNYDQDAVSDRTITAHVYMPAGPCHIQISVGSGTLKTHTAGNLQSAWLDNTTNVQWTIPLMPVTVSEQLLYSKMPIVGNNYNISLATSLPALPSSISSGSITYDGIAPLPALLPADQVGSCSTIKVKADPDGDAPDPEIFPYLCMKTKEASTAVNISGGGKWTLTRLPDYTVNHVVVRIPVP